MLCDSHEGDVGDTAALTEVQLCELRAERCEVQDVLGVHFSCVELHNLQLQTTTRNGGETSSGDVAQMIVEYQAVQLRAAPTETRKLSIGDASVVRSSSSVQRIRLVPDHGRTPIPHGCFPRGIDRGNLSRHMPCMTLIEENGEHLVRIVPFRHEQMVDNFRPQKETLLSAIKKQSPPRLGGHMVHEHAHLAVELWPRDEPLNLNPITRPKCSHGRGRRVRRGCCFVLRRSCSCPPLAHEEERSHGYSSKCQDKHKHDSMPRYEVASTARSEKREQAGTCCFQITVLVL